jgi:predicted TIM-barrel fold metal-dependent hydrolase
VSEIEYALWDADTHYYETPDCWSRHIDKRHQDLAIRTVDNGDGTDSIFVGDRRIDNYIIRKFREAEPPGSLMRVLRNPSLSKYDDAKVHLALRPEYRDRAARLRTMDEQHVEGSVLLPTVGLIAEAELLPNIDAVVANTESFNRWLEEEWGFDYEGRIFGVPCITLVDVDRAVAELNTVVERGARIVNLRPGMVLGRPISHPDFDRFWAAVDEMRIPVGLHCNTPDRALSSVFGENPEAGARDMSAFQWSFVFCDVPIMTTLAAMVFDNLFGRFPNLRIVSIENGSAWVPYLFKVMQKGWRMGALGPWRRGRPDERPSAIMKRHLWVAPFPEDDKVSLVELIGVDRVLFGSDYPHPEGEAEPAHFAESMLGRLDDGAVRKVMRDNLRDLLGVGEAALGT